MALQLQAGRPRKLAYQQPLKNDYRLLELTDAMLQEVLDGTVVFKGCSGEEAVLCTRSATYAVKAVETTNTLLLVPDPAGASGNDGQLRSPLSQLNSDGVAPTPLRTGIGTGLQTQLQRDEDASAGSTPVVAGATASAHLELVPAAPRLERLDALLQERPFGLSEDSADMEVDTVAGGQRAYTFAELLERVQASEEELLCALGERGALLLDGRWRLLDPAYLGGLLEVLLCTAVECGWAGSGSSKSQGEEAMDEGEASAGSCSAWRIPQGAAVDALAGEYDARVIAHCLRAYGELVPGTGEPPALSATRELALDGGCVYALQPDKVARYFARRLLLQRQRWLRSDFMAAWRAAVPEGMAIDERQQLRGEALPVDDAPEGPSLKAFPASALPPDPAARFAALFAERPRWVWEELEPYVSGLRVAGQSAEAVLLRYTRAVQSRPSDPLVYTQR